MDSVTTLPASESIVLKFCDAHQNALGEALIARGLQEEMGRGGGVNPDNPMDESQATLLVTAIRFFGADVLATYHEGCPMCAYDHIIEHVADAAVRKFREPQ